MGSTTFRLTKTSRLIRVFCVTALSGFLCACSAGSSFDKSSSRSANGQNPNASLTSVEVITGRSVQITFSDAVADATNLDIYSLSGSGKGTLALHPSSISLVSENTYRLVWSEGEMLNGGDITITVEQVDPSGDATTVSVTDSAGGIGTSPTIQTVTVQTGSTVDVVFSEAMNEGVTTASNYTITGTGKGSLTANPTSVSLLTGNTYRLAWSNGEMLNGGDITVTVSGAKDVVGHAISSSGTHTAGAIGVGPAVPTLTAFNPVSPSSVSTTPAMTGTASADTVTLNFFSDVTCASSSIGSGTKATFEGAGISLTVTANALTTVYAKAFDAVGNASTCTAIGSYRHDNTAPTVVTGINHATTNLSLTASPAISWSGGAVDSGVGFDHYEYSIGTSAGGTDIKNWTSNATSTSVTASGLTLAAGTTYYVNVKTVDSLGNASTVVTSAGWTPPAVQTVTLTALYPTNGANWNDYVENNGSTYFNGTDQSCNGDATIDGGTRNGQYGGPNACINGGEFRKVSIAAEASCTNLAATDFLGVFNWTCVDSGGNAIFYSTGLKSSKRLADLLNASSWKSNYVQIRKSGYLLYESVSSNTWYGNAVRSLDGLDNATAGDETVTGVTGVNGKQNNGTTTAPLHAYELNGTGVIYTLTATKTLKGVHLNASKQSLVVFPGARMVYGAVANACSYWDGMLTTGHTCLAALHAGINYTWVEGAFDADYQTSVYGTITLYNNKFFRFRKASFLNNKTGTRNVFISGSTVQFGIFQDIGMFNNSGDGFYFAGSTTENIFNNIHISNGSGYRAFSSGGASFMNNVIVGLTSMGYASPVLQWDAGTNRYNTFTHLTVANNVGHALDLTASSNDTYVQVLGVNNGGSVFYANNSNGHKLAKLWLTNNGGKAIELAGTSTGTVISSDIVVGNNSTGITTEQCSAAAAGNTIASGSSDCSGTGITLTSGKNSSGAIKGPVTSDTQNANIGSVGVTGLLTYASITDWFKFDNLFRTWGRAANIDFFNSSNRTACSTGHDCAIWDLRVSSSDTQGLLNANGSFTANAACPASVNGDVTMTDQNSLQAHTFLINAKELMADGLGNENGLCESNEACIYSPNLGSYQGEGTLSQCTFNANGGSVTGVTMYGYGQNGG